MKKILLIVLMGLTVGCKSLNRLTSGSDSPMPNQSSPTLSSVEGVASGPLDCADVQRLDLDKPFLVYANGEMLNIYEFTFKKPNRLVCFGNKAIIVSAHQVIITTSPAILSGQSWKIETVQP